MIAAQISPNSVQALNPDFCKLAESYGARSTKPSNLKELQNDITEAFCAKTPNHYSHIRYSVIQQCKLQMKKDPHGRALIEKNDLGGGVRSIS